MRSDPPCKGRATQGCGTAEDGLMARRRDWTRPPRLEADMYERQADQGRQDAARSNQRPPDTQLDESERSHRGEMSRQAPSSMERQAGAWEQGGWTGYVVPYRYYGPGYRGVGYYSVMYQGSDEGEGQPQDE